jgi:hypothetical protein
MLMADMELEVRSISLWLVHQHLECSGLTEPSVIGKDIIRISEAISRTGLRQYMFFGQNKVFDSR